MELQGKIIAATNARSGSNARGEWKAQDFVIETHDTYPKKMCFSVMGLRLDNFTQQGLLQVGKEVTVYFDIDAHEYQGRWFNSIRAYDIRLVDPAAVAGNGAAPFAPENAPFTPAPQAQPAAPQTDPFAAANEASPASETTDDLPF